MTNPALGDYVKSARAQGLSDVAIKTNLMEAGWVEQDIVLAMGTNSSTAVPLPPPSHPGMWITFQYILLFITLYMTSISLGGLLYQWADKLIPDTTNAASIYSFVDSYLLQGYLATIIVAFPIFAILFVILRKNLLAHPEIRGVRARQVLFYITLVIAFLIIVSYVISIIYGLLSGDVTGRTVAHFIITLFIAVPIFWYLLSEVRNDRSKA
jgi:hypothetical protein